MIKKIGEDMTKNDTENNTKLVIILIVSIVILIAVVAIGTYAFFTTRITDNRDNPTDPDTNLTTANIEFNMEDGTITGNNLVPGDSVVKKFTVHNKGTGTITYNLVWTTAVNNFINKNDLIITLNDGTTDVITESDNVIFPNTSTNPQVLKNGLTIDSGETKELTLTITYKNTEEDQTADIGKSFSAEINLGD